jgi:pyridoxal 5'-phosphate synthase pdxT subunit
MSGRPRVGVLALQGDVREHLAMLTRVGADAVAVRRPEELARVAGLVLPGGESSVIDKLARAFGMQHPIRAAIADGLPVFGTCAGLILLADRVTGAIDGQQTFGGLDVVVERNAFGGQSESFETEVEIAAFDGAAVHAAFIRAPIVTSAGEGVRVLGALAGGRIVAVEQGNLLATAFHPEVSGEKRFHERFLETVRERR